MRLASQSPRVGGATLDQSHKGFGIVQMELEAISGAATVALTSTIVFMLIAKTWNSVSRTVNSTPNFSDHMLHEAAQRFRDELDRLSTSQSTYLSGVLVFATLFVAAYLLQAQTLFSNYPSWQLYLQMTFLALVASFALVCLARTMIAKYRIRFVRDANIAVGHQLLQLPAHGTSIYHDIETTAGVVDHVIVGQQGLYAVNVVARRCRKRGDAMLDENQIEFSNSKAGFSIVDISAKTARLQKELRELLGHKIRMRSVIAVPGWNVAEQFSDDHLLVNERTIGMLTGWKDSSDYLMNEDVRAIQQELTRRCGRH